jgi:neutral ceramidase
MNASMSFGAAVREITPSFPSWLHGYADRDRLSEGVNEPLQIGCLALGDGERTVLVVTCDLVGIQQHVCERLYGLIERETGIPYPYILISCSHTHFAPALHAQDHRLPHLGILGPDPRFVADFEAKLVEAARESLRGMRPGWLEQTRLQVPSVLFNRRTIAQDGSVQTNFMYPLDPASWTLQPTDTQLTAVRLKDETGVRAVLVNFGCHPVTGGPSRETDHYRISGEYVHYLRQTISSRYACPAFFTLGAAGDAVPINRYGDCRQRIGSVLGNAVILAERTYRTAEDAHIQADFLSVDIETIVKTDPSTAQATYEQARAAFSSALEAADVDVEGEAYRRAAEAYHASAMALVRSRLYSDNRYAVKVQFVHIAGMTWVGLPFEVLSEISLRMKARFPHSVLVSCAGGYQGYLPLGYEYERGGYEASARSTHFVPGTGDRLLEAILDKLSGWPG